MSEKKYRYEKLKPEDIPVDEFGRITDFDFRFWAKYDYKFEPLRVEPKHVQDYDRGDGLFVEAVTPERRIVASEEEWKRLECLCSVDTESAAEYAKANGFCDVAPFKILIDLTNCLDEWDGWIFKYHQYFK